MDPLLSNTKILFLNGPLIQRELILPLGEFIIGNHEDSNLNVSFEHENYFILSIHESGVTLSEKNEFIWINGIKYSGIELKNKSVIDLDGLCFILGNKEETLSVVDLPKRKIVRKRKRKIFWLYLVIFLIMFLGLAANFFYYYNHNHNHNHNQTKPIMLKSWVKKQIPPGAKDQIIVKWINYNTIDISGVVEKESFITTFINQIKNSPVELHYINNVVTQNDIVEDVNEILRMHGYDNVTVTSQHNTGVISLYGEFHYGKKWQQISKLISAVPGIKSWNVNLSSTDDFSSFLAFLSNQNKSIFDKLNIKLDKNVEISGILDLHEKEKLKNILNKFRKKNKNFPLIIYQNITIDFNDLFTSSINTIGRGSKGYYIILKNGAQVDVNTKVNDVDRVTNITVHTVTVEGPNEIYHIPVTISG